MDKSQIDKLRVNPILIGASLLLCFPIGLFLVWGHPSWSKCQKWQWTGALAVALVFIMIVASVQDAATKKSLAEADRLWTAGQKVEAVAKYKAVIKSSMSGIDESQRPTVFQRVIEFDLEQGNVTEAKAMVEKALDARVALSFERADAMRLNAQVQAEREANSMAAGGKKNGESEKGAKTSGEKATASSVYDEGYKEGVAMGENHIKGHSRRETEVLAEATLPTLERSYRQAKELADTSGNTGYSLESQRMKGRLDGYRKALRDGGFSAR